MNASVLPPKKPPLRSCNNYWVSAWCPENELMVELLPSALLSRGLGVQSRGGTLALSEVQERRPSRDHEKPVMTSQTQAAEEPGLPDPPDALGKQGARNGQPLCPHLIPAEQGRCRHMIWNSLRAPSMEPPFLSKQTPFHPTAAAEMRVAQDQATDVFFQTRGHLLCAGLGTGHRAGDKAAKTSGLQALTNCRVAGGLDRQRRPAERRAGKAAVSHVGQAGQEEAVSGTGEASFQPRTAGGEEGPGAGQGGTQRAPSFAGNR